MPSISFSFCLPSLTNNSERDHNDGNKYLSEYRCLGRAKGLWVCRCDIRGYSPKQRQTEAGLVIWESTRLLSTGLRKHLCLYNPTPKRSAMTKVFWFLTWRFFSHITMIIMYYDYYYVLLLLLLCIMTFCNVDELLHTPLQVSFSFLLIVFRSGCFSDWLV